MQKTIAVLGGDGIGPEVTKEAIKVLTAVATRYNHEFIFKYGLIGAAAIDKYNDPFPKETLGICKESDAILFGAIGDPKYDNDPTLKVRPEQGLLRMRKELNLFANIRPVKSYSSLLNRSPLKQEIIKNVDLVVFRELTGGIYFGKQGTTDEGKTAFDTCTYHENEILRVAELAFKKAIKRNNKVTLVDKANVLETSRLWRKVVQSVSQNYPEVQTEFMYVDNAAMQLILNPKQFDVILTENMFGDILTDEASVIGGSIGLMPSASIGNKHAVYEPIHGSYPQAKGKNIANPIGSILSAAMMLEMSFGLEIESCLVQRAVESIIQSEFLTEDLTQINPYTTAAIGDKISNFILQEMYEEV